MSAFDNEMTERWLRALPRPLNRPAVQGHRFWRGVQTSAMAWLLKRFRVLGFGLGSAAVDLNLEEPVETGAEYSRRIAEMTKNDPPPFPEVADEADCYRTTLDYVLDQIENVIVIEELNHPITNTSRSLRLLHQDVSQVLKRFEKKEEPCPAPSATETPKD